MIPFDTADGNAKELNQQEETNKGRFCS